MRLLVAIYLCFSITNLSAQDTVLKPLYDDPVYHGAADPVIIYNKQKKCWWVFYTNRGQV